VATRITMRCREHGTERDFFFDNTPPAVHHDSGCEHDEPACTFDRVWTAPAIGAVKGAGGSPARTAAKEAPPVAKDFSFAKAKYRGA
jgi:hypothetical protein